ncbi:hypothetical protein CMV_024929 [Castanea mollissima]|uniref:DUF7026 domain-containing protein n=1 Tax=Castanea mollissima TaxID=60419 RepID=A0A8J4VHD7_9ROSI|nr:hypothetical protein CMV_024929 [Castanea mollissima]
MKKSKELLFTELCQYLAFKGEEVKMKWRKLDEEEKWVLVKGFVSDWRVDFHPLSARSVKEMVQEYLLEENPSTKSSLLVLFPGLKRLMGFTQNKQFHLCCPATSALSVKYRKPRSPQIPSLLGYELMKEGFLRKQTWRKNLPL